LIRPEFRGELLGQQKKLTRIWLAFAEAILIFLGMPYLFPPVLHPEWAPETVRTGLWLVAIVEVGVLAWWNRRYLGTQSILRDASTNRRLEPLSGFSKPKSPLEEGAVRVISWFWVVKLVGFAFAGSLALYGLVLAVVGGYFADQYILSFVGGLLLAYQFPTAESFERLLRQYEDRAGA
jgi:hypothetical protein